MACPQFALADVAPLDRPDWISTHLSGATGAGVRVAIVDSGWHRARINAGVRPGVGFIDNRWPLTPRMSPDDDDRIGHGTACAELILQVAPDAQIFPVRVFGETLETSVEHLIAGIEWAIANDIRLINLSLGSRCVEHAVPLYRACDMARRHGCTIVAAAHIGGVRSFPAAFDCVIGVAAARFSSRFSYSFRPGPLSDCAACGYGYRIVMPDGQTAVINSTSFAAPNIVGILALFIEAYGRTGLDSLRTRLAHFSSLSHAGRNADMVAKRLRR